MKTNSQIRQDTLAALKGQWGVAVLSFLIFFLLTLALSSPNTIHQMATATPSYWLFGGSTFLMILILYPLQVGLINSYKIFVEKGDSNITSNIFKIGFGNYMHNLGGCLLMYFLIILATILFIIPGIILGLAYSMAPYIFAEEPDLSIIDSLKKSRTMMRGHKMDLFLIWLGLFGFAILSILTIGIALFWIIPYYYSVFGEFYLSLKNDALQV